MRSRSIPRADVARQAYERLRDWIVNARLAPGSPLIESEIASILGLSRSHVRAAFQRLEQAGFVTRTPIGAYSRTRVAPLTAADVREIFTIIGSLEGVAARSAAALEPAERRTLTAELRRINDELSSALMDSRSDHDRANNLDIAFHRTLVERAAGPRLLQFHQTVKPQAERYERTYMSLLVKDTSASVLEHARIVDAIAAGDVDAAQHAVEVNWRNAAERFCSIIAVVGERGRGATPVE